MIIGQSIYQLVVTFTLYFAGAQILGYDVDNDEELKKQLNTIVFNTFVWMQIFNEFNNRRLDNKFNVFERMHKNYWFMGINALMIGGQIMIIFVGGQALNVVRIDGTQWAICILCAIFCMPFAVLLRCLPDRHFQVVIDIVTRSFNVVWNPFARAMKFIFSPIGKMFYIATKPIKQLLKSKKEEDESSTELPSRTIYDEEAPRPKDEKTPDSDRPLTSPPPITLTVPS